MIDKLLQRDLGSNFDYNILNGNYFGVPGRLEWVVQDNQIVFTK